MPTDYKQFGIQKLLSHNFVVFIPISTQPKDYDVIVEYAGTIQTIAIIPAYLTKDSLTAKLIKSKPPHFRDFLLCCSYLIVNPKSNKTWLIPTSEVADLTCISLKKRYDEFLLDNELIECSVVASEYTKQAEEIAKQLRS